MKIAIHTLGTRGDVQPYIALGLRRAGHDVLLAAPAQFSDLAASHGIGFAALPAEFLQMLDDPEFKGAVARGVGPGSILKLLKRFLRGWQKRTFGLGSTARRTRRSSRTAATLYSYSPSVVPVPHEWNSDVLVSGYWFLDESCWKPSPALASFLAAGPSPVYVGFGSMPIADAAAMTGVVVEALNISGRRGVLAAGWGGAGLKAQCDLPVSWRPALLGTSCRNARSWSIAAARKAVVFAATGHRTRCRRRPRYARERSEGGRKNIGRARYRNGGGIHRTVCRKRKVLKRRKLIPRMLPASRAMHCKNTARVQMKIVSKW